ncbi:MAG: NUDIX domain-containing protein [Ignavibacteriales bacterium]|nr:NUDIX domain-containing protein [Ignavibacteriales bacterium]
MIDQSWYKRPDGIPVRVAAGGIVVWVEGGKTFVALVKEDGRPDYILPKGKVKDGETLEQAARREILEEAGLGRLELRRYLGVRERLDFKKKNWKITHYFLFRMTEQIAEPTDPRKRYFMEWFAPSDLPAMLWPEQRELLKNTLTASDEATMQPKNPLNTVTLPSPADE